MELTRQRFAWTIAGSALLVLFVLYFLFHPLMHQLRIRGSECSRIEAEAAEARGRAFIFKDKQRRKGLIAETEVTVAINELTRRGNLKGAEFISLTPKKIERPEGKSFKILPIEMEIKSTYENLGNFLASLDELQKSLITVRSFRVVLDKEDVPKVETQLTLDLYLSE